MFLGVINDSSTQSNFNKSTQKIWLHYYEDAAIKYNYGINQDDCGDLEMIIVNFNASGMHP